MDVDSTGWGNSRKRGVRREVGSAQTSGDVDEIVYGISFPKGIWYANDNGGLETLTSAMLLQYKRHGDACGRIASRSRRSRSSSRFPGGTRDFDGHWPDGTYSKFVSVSQGSTKPKDHVEEERPTTTRWSEGESADVDHDRYPYVWHWGA